MERTVGLYQQSNSRGFAEATFRLLIAVLWTQSTVLTFVLQIIKRLPVIGQLYGYVLPTAIVLLTAFSLPLMLKRLRVIDFIFYFACAALVLLTVVLCPENAVYIRPELWRILGTVLPMLFIGVSYAHELSKKDLFWASLLGVAAVFAYQLYYIGSGRRLSNDNMDMAYHLLPSVMYLIYWALERKKARYWLISVLSTLMLFLFGTRGPVVAAVLFMLVGIFLNILRKSSPVTVIFSLALFAAIIAVLCSGDILVSAAKHLSELFEDIGFSTRVFDRFIDGEMAKSNSRERLYAAVGEAIAQRPLFGYGLMGDRLTVGFYVHNIFLELWSHFGVIFGTAASAALLGIPMAALVRVKRTELFNFVLMLLCTVFVKLMFTGSYLFEGNLFFLLGIGVSILRSRTKNDII